MSPRAATVSVTKEWDYGRAREWECHAQGVLTPGPRPLIPVKGQQFPQTQTRRPAGRTSSYGSKQPPDTTMASLGAHQTKYKRTNSVPISTIAPGKVLRTG